MQMLRPIGVQGGLYAFNSARNAEIRFIFGEYEFANIIEKFVLVFKRPLAALHNREL
jgi:hypothetical protein